MSAFLKKNKGLLIAAAAILLVVGGWLLMWQRIAGQVEKAAYDSVFDQLSFDGAYYARCGLEIVQEYLPEVGKIDDSLCGEQLGTLSFPTEDGTVNCPLYACKPLEDAGKKRALLMLGHDGSPIPYELSGFQYLDDDPSVWAVCASYGIGYPEDIAAVTVKEQSGTELETITDPERIKAFYDWFVALGENIGQEGQAKAYYDSYVAKFGETDKIRLANGTVEATDDAAYDEAMAYWTENLRLVTIRLHNGYQLRDCIYAPVPGVFSAYGDYAFSEAFFS